MKTLIWGVMFSLAGCASSLDPNNPRPFITHDHNNCIERDPLKNYRLEDEAPEICVAFVWEASSENKEQWSDLVQESLRQWDQCGVSSTYFREVKSKSEVEPWETEIVIQDPQDFSGSLLGVTHTNESEYYSHNGTFDDQTSIRIKDGDAPAIEIPLHELGHRWGLVHITGTIMNPYALGKTHLDAADCDLLIARFGVVN